MHHPRPEFPAARPCRKASEGASPATTREDAVAAVLQEYFDALRDGDSRRLLRVFHAQGLYATFVGGRARVLRVDEYLSIVEAQPSPASRGVPRKDEIVSIDFTGPDTASVRLRSGMLQQSVTNLLTMQVVDGRWQAIAEVSGWETAPSLAGAV